MRWWCGEGAVACGGVCGGRAVGLNGMAFVLDFCSLLCKIT